MKTRNSLMTVLLLSSLLAGCGTSTIRYSVAPGIVIEAAELRMPTSTVAVGVVLQDGRVVGVVPGNARPLIDVPLAVVGAGSTVAGAAVMGSALRKAVGLGAQQEQP